MLDGAAVGVEVGVAVGRDVGAGDGGEVGTCPVGINLYLAGAVRAGEVKIKKRRRSTGTRPRRPRTRERGTCVENNHWFGSAQATLKLVYLAQNEVFSARSWTGDHLYARSRGLADLSRHIRSNWTILNVS